MIIGPYRVLLNMVTVEIVGSAMFVVVFTYGYRRQDCHYLLNLLVPKLCHQLSVVCLWSTGTSPRKVTQLTPRLIRVTGHNNTGTGAEPSYQPHSVYTGPLDHPSSELCDSRYVLKINF